MASLQEFFSGGPALDGRGRYINIRAENSLARRLNPRREVLQDVIAGRVEREILFTSTSSLVGTPLAKIYL